MARKNKLQKRDDFAVSYGEKTAFGVAYEMGQRDMVSEFQARLAPYIAAVVQYEKLTQMIDTFSIMTAYPGARKDLRATLSGVASELGDRFVNLVQTARYCGVDEGRLPGDRNAARIEGLIRFVNGDDDGATLRAASMDRGGVTTELLSLVPYADAGGRPPTLSPWRRWLGEYAADLKAENPEWTHRELARGVHLRLLALENPNEIEREALGKVEASNDKTRLIRSAVNVFYGKKKANVHRN